MHEYFIVYIVNKHSFSLSLWLLIYAQNMDVITNKEVNVYLDNEKGTLCLTGMLVGTMVFGDI